MLRTAAHASLARIIELPSRYTRDKHSGGRRRGDRRRGEGPRGPAFDEPTVLSLDRNSVTKSDFIQEDGSRAARDSDLIPEFAIGDDGASRVHLPIQRDLGGLSR